MLLNMPGITSKNVHRIMNKVTDLRHLVSLSEIELGDILDNSATGEILYKFLHRKHKSLPAESGQSSNSKSGHTNKASAISHKTGKQKSSDYAGKKRKR